MFCCLWFVCACGNDCFCEERWEGFDYLSAIGLVVKYLVANEMPRVRFPDGAILFSFHLSCLSFYHLTVILLVQLANAPRFVFRWELAIRSFNNHLLWITITYFRVDVHLTFVKMNLTECE